MSNSKEGRNVIVIIDKILEIIPKEETHLIKDLQTYTDSLWNQAPEALRGRHCWLQLINIMNNNVQLIDQPWKEQLLQIFYNH